MPRTLQQRLLEKRKRNLTFRTHTIVFGLGHNNMSIVAFQARKTPKVMLFRVSRIWPFRPVSLPDLLSGSFSIRPLHTIASVPLRQTYRAARKLQPRRGKKTPSSVKSQNCFNTLFQRRKKNNKKKKITKISPSLALLTLLQ